MKIDGAQAGLTLETAIIKELIVRNNLISAPLPSETYPTIEMDYKTVALREDEDKFAGMLELNVKAYYKEGRTTHFKLDMTQGGLFVGAKTSYPSEEEFRDALELNGLTTLVSMARANISALTSNIFSENCIKMPMINIFKLKKLKDEERAKTDKINQ